MLTLTGLQHGDLTLGLITRPMQDDADSAWLESRSLRLLEAVESVVEGRAHAATPYPHPHLVRTGALSAAHGFPPASAEGHWSGKASASADELDATAALFEAFRQSAGQLGVVESFVRLGSGQWVIREEGEVEGDGEAREVYVALPGKVGKEGSLVDAAEELRRVKRGYVGV